MNIASYIDFDQTSSLSSVTILLKYFGNSSITCFTIVFIHISVYIIIVINVAFANVLVMKNIRQIET